MSENPTPESEPTPDTSAETSMEESTPPNVRPDGEPFISNRPDTFDYEGDPLPYTPEDAGDQDVDPDEVAEEGDTEGDTEADPADLPEAPEAPEGTIESEIIADENAAEDPNEDPGTPQPDDPFTDPA